MNRLAFLFATGYAVLSISAAVPSASDAGRGALKTGLQGGAPASTPSFGHSM